MTLYSQVTRVLSDSDTRVTSDGSDRIIDEGWSWMLQAYIGEVWTNISRDVLSRDYDLVAERGINGNGVTDRVAGVGALTAVLDNGESNSAGLIGYYAHDHVNLRSGFEKGLKLRLLISYLSQEKAVWVGYLDDLQAEPGQFKERTSYLTAFDFMQKCVKHKLSRIPVQEDKRSDQNVQTILDNMSATPASSSLQTDTYTTPLSLHTEQDENSTAMSALQKICQSALGYVYIGEDETFIFELESTRYESVVAATLSDTMSGLELSRGESRYANKVIGVYHPTNVDDTGDTVLASLLNEFELDAGDTETIPMRYRDPANLAVRISGKDVVDPLVADTHFKMSSVSGDNGNDLNANLVSALRVGGNVTDAQVTNSAGIKGYISKLEIVGNGVYQYEPGEIIQESGDADVTLTYDFFYQSDYYRTKDLVAAIHLRTSNDITHVDSVTFYADSDAILMGYALDCDIGSRVIIEETATGLSNDYIINKVTYTILRDGRLKVDWLLEPANSFNFFQLDVDILDGDAVLSPFA